MAFDYDKYIRPGKLPHIWCPGCAHGTVMKSIIRGIDRVGLDKDRTVIVSGIGCASRMPGYVDFDDLVSWGIFGLIDAIENLEKSIP